MHRYVIWIALTLVLVGTVDSREVNAQSCAKEVGRLVSLDGLVEIQQTGAISWQRLRLDAPMCQGDTIRVGARSRAAIALVNDAVLRLDQNTTMRLTEVVREPEKRSLLSLIEGVFQSFSRKPRRLEVNTAYLNGTIEGTEFVFELRGDKASLIVLEGRVVASNSRGRVTVTGGQVAEASGNTAPGRRIVARPRDAVQWGLYYPPILVGVSNAASPTGRAAALLNVGRVGEAETKIARAIAGNTDTALAYALRAIINVVRNRTDDALADAQKAAQLAPRSAAAKIALSYAQQARFDLPEALGSMLDAVKAEPRNALAWARLAELHLSLGQRGQSSDAAIRAVELAPDVARTRSVLGFAALSELDITTAAQSFQEAIKLGPAAPLPRLGLGLTKIKRGDLEAGRREIDIAVGLDSTNALLRSYLGKAYFEEKRSPLDAQQLAIAKELDPQDPTPWLYDAIRKQTENRPGEALTDLQASIHRNDNRAIYRGRLQLDQDRAARGSSLARIYKDLGFEQLGLNESTKSLTLDPSNAAAHRFLSDTYRGMRRREIARVSELLQAQLLQDVNINPVQPSISETNLNIGTGGGPAQVGFNEFTPLFERNQVQLNVSGLLGNQNTRGGEAVASAVYNKFSVSAGAYRYNTEGFRPNADVEHDIYNLFTQAALSPALNIQAELRQRKSESGDLAFNFNRDTGTKPDFNRDLETTLGRIGLRWSPSPSSDVVVSYIFNDRNEEQQDVIGSFKGLANSNAQVEDDGHQIDAQYLYRQPNLNVTTGLGRTLVERHTQITAKIQTAFAGIPPGCPIPFPPIPCVPGFDPAPAGADGLPPLDATEDIDHNHAYIYTNTNYPKNVTWTFGGSYDDYDNESFNLTKWNYKLGVQWDVTKDVRLRAATFRVLKPIIVANMTLEPTQVAGFNQFFDDSNATLAKVYGIGADWRILPNFSVGAEAMWRNYDETLSVSTTTPTSVSPATIVREDRHETIYRAYAFWSPKEYISTSAEISYDRFNAETIRIIPLNVDTWTVPLSVRYFSRTGLFANFGATYVNQRVDRKPTSLLEDGHTHFFTVDAGLGFRLPGRRGIISLQVTNLLDRNFKYQDDSYREFRDNPTTGPYFPERAVSMRAVLHL